MGGSSEEKRNVGAVITYAIISVALRLLAAQLGVFNLWYQRRSYERTRGELITMLYEKTLNRKILGAKQEEKDEQLNSHDSNGDGQEREGNGSHEPVKTAPYGFLTRMLAAIRSVFTRKAKSDGKKDAASMGKIMNLMRNDVYEVAQRFWDFADIVTQPAGLGLYARCIRFGCVSANQHWYRSPPGTLREEAQSRNRRETAEDHPVH
jgi:hypothetical protein